MSANRTIRVAAITDIPYIEFNQTTNKWSGIFVDNLQAACAWLAFRCELFNAPEPSTSESNTTINEVFDSVFGEVFNGTADIGLSAVTITTNRFSSFSFIDSFLRRTYLVVIHQDHLISFKSSDFLFHLFGELMQKNVWFSVCAVFLTTVLAGTGFEVIQHRVTSPKNFVKIFTNWSFRALGTGLGIQGIGDFEETARSNSWRPSKIIFSLSWTIYTFFLLATLSGALPSIFTFGVNQQLPFNSVKQLLESDFVSYGGDTIISMLNVSQLADHSTLAGQMLLLPSNSVNQTKYERFVKLAQSSRAALIINLETLMEISHISCEMIVAIDNLEEVAIASLILPKGSPLQPIFEYGYSSTKQVGLGHHGIREVALFVATAERKHPTGEGTFSCYRRKVNKKPTFKERNLRLKTLQFLFWFFAGGISTSLVVMVCELTFYSFCSHPHVRAFRWMISRSAKRH